MKTKKSQTAKSGGQNRESHGRMIRSKPSKGPESKRGSACVAIFWAPTRLLAGQHTPMPRGGLTNSQSLILDGFDLPGFRPGWAAVCGVRTLQADVGTIVSVATDFRLINFCNIGISLSDRGPECKRLLNEVAGATDATREAGSRSCKGIEGLRD